MISDRIKETRKKANLSQEQFAEHINVSRQAITRWETGRGTPDLDNLKAISNTFNVSIDYLLENDNLTETDHFDQSFHYSYKDYVGKKCDVILTEWNDNIYDAFILSEDKDFLFYCITGKEPIAGTIGKRFISEITIAKQTKECKSPEFTQLALDFFLNRPINIYLNEKYFWSGLIGPETAYADITLFALSENSLSFRHKNNLLQNISFQDIVKLEAFI